MSDRFKFRILHECCTCGKFRWLFFDVAHSNNPGFENHFIAWSERPCGCPWHAIGQGFKAVRDPEQYTGIKDANKVLIFEGDIIRVEYSGEWNSTHKIVWGGKDYPAFDLVPDLGDTSNALSYVYATCSLDVIGNIHENPELLTEKDKDNEKQT